MCFLCLMCSLSGVMIRYLRCSVKSFHSGYVGIPVYPRTACPLLSHPQSSTLSCLAKSYPVLLKPSPQLRAGETPCILLRTLLQCSFLLSGALPHKVQQPQATILPLQPSKTVMLFLSATFLRRSQNVFQEESQS